MLTDTSISIVIELYPNKEVDMDTSNRILRLPEVMEKTGVRRSSVYAWMKDGSFPKQIKMGMRASGWIEREIDEWIERRASGRP